MAALPFPSVQPATTQAASGVLDSPAPGALAEPRGGIISADDAAAKIREPRFVSDRTLARACKIVLAGDEHADLHPQARMLLDTLPIVAGGKRPDPSPF